jgi:hypothetical protein
MADELQQQIPYPALGDPYAVIGGLSVSIVSQPRPTVDVDLVVWLDPKDWKAFLESARKHGIKTRVADALEFAQKHRVLLMQHVDSGINIDISFGALPFEQEMIERSESFSLGTLKLPIATPEDLIIMKTIAHREKDLRDIQNIMRVRQELDFERIKHWVHEFAVVLEAPELDTELLDLIEAQKRSK